MHILVELDGVLKDQSDQPIATGILMVSTLTVYNKLTYMTASTSADATRWLDVHKVVDFDDIIDSSVKLEGEDLAKRQITFARARGKVDLFITSNPKLWTYAFEQGITVAMFAVPAYIRPEFRPDAPKRIRSWGEIEEAIERQNVALTKDIRASRTEALNFE